jgi:hypothetical protein
MSRQKRIEELVNRILREKELEDCEHVRRSAKLGCCCRRCKAARAK